jgi:AraC-like DNA-binding protein
VLVRIAVGSETYERAVASTVGGHRDAGNVTMVRGAAIRIERTTIDAVVHADPAEGTASMRAPVGPTSDDESFLVVDLNCIADLGELQRLVARCRGSLLAVYSDTARCHQVLTQMVAQRLRVHVAPALSGFLEPLLRGALLHDPRSAVPLSEVIAPLLGANAERDGRDGASCAGGRVTLLTTAALVAAWRRRGTSPRFRPTQLLAVALGVSEATVQRRCGLLLKLSPFRVVQRVTGAWVVALVERGMTVTVAARLLGLARPASVYPLVRLAFGCSLRHLRSRSGGAFTDSGGDCRD